MSDGATNPNPTQVQCANCSAEDSIVIAGKTFCANCGTPQKPGAAQAASASSTPSLSTTTPASGAAPAGPTSEKMPLDIDASLPNSQPAVAQTSPSAPNILDSIEPDMSAASPVSIGTTVAPIVDSSSQTTDTSALSSDQLHDSSQGSADAGIQKYSSRPASYDSTAAPNQPSEIDSLSDGKEESVMSDSALAELSQTNDLPVPTEISSLETTQAPAPVESSYKLDLTKPDAENLPKAMSDIRPATSGNTAPAATAIKVPAPQPSPAASQVRAAIAATPPPAPSAAPSVATPPAATPPVPLAASQPSSPAAPVAPTIAPAPPAATPAAAQVPSSSASLATPAVATIAQQDANMAAAVAATPKSGVKASSVALSIVGLLLVGAYIWQVNYPNLALKVAGSKAGISANFPGYVPNGWKLSGNIISSPGNISYNIAGQKDGQNLAVTESKTNWDSQALAENYVAPKSANYLALQAQGLTIYIYNDNQASWVNNGNWYRLEGSAKGLSQDQIIKIATSL